MRVYSTSSGLVVSLSGPKDRNILDSGKPLECKITDFETGPIVRIKIEDVKERVDHFAEEGFDLRGIPRNTRLYDCKVIEILLSQQVYQRLIKEEYFVSRTMIDRVDMTYWEPKN